MSIKHRTKHSNKKEKTKCIKNEFNETVMVLVLILYLVLKEETESQNFNKEHNKEDINKEYISTHKTCVASVTSETIPLSESTPKIPLVIQKPVIIKVPIVLAETQVTIPILFTFTLENNALEVKRIKKNVYLNECSLLPNSEILFISGFIKKSLEYTSTNCIGESELNGMIKNDTVKIPFNCTTKIKFITKPIFTNNVSEQEVELLNFHIDSDSCGENATGHNLREQSSIEYKEFFNEKFFYELVSSEIIETEILEDPIEEQYDIPRSAISYNITEKSVLYLTIKILQNQQVIIC